MSTTTSIQLGGGFVPTSIGVEAENTNREIEVNVGLLPTLELSQALEPINMNHSIRVITRFIKNKCPSEEWLERLSEAFRSVREGFDTRHFFLYSLNNWKEDFVKKKEMDITAPATQGSSFETSKALKELNFADISFIDSADYFSFVKYCECAETINYIAKKVWTKDFIWNVSREEEDKGVTLKDLFGECKLLETIADKDVAKAYSALQYLEAYFLIEKMVENCDRECEIVFFLPNNEADYYTDNDGSLRSFEKDIKELFRIRQVKVPEKVSIHFSLFKWGDKLNYRPYNVGPPHKPKPSQLKTMLETLGEVNP